MNRFLKASFFLIPVALVFVFAPRVGAFVQDTEKTIYFTALDKDGKVIKDLQAAELAAAEDGKFRPATSLKPATAPMSIVMLADTSAAVGGAGLGTRSTSADAAGDMMRDIRAAFAEFTKQMLASNPENELALMEFGQASIMITDFTSKGDVLDKEISRLNVKPNAASVLMEAVQESSKELSKRKNRRRAIVSINVMPDNEQSRELNNVAKELANGGATYFSVSLQKGDIKNAARGPVLQQFADSTGGKRDVIVGQSALIAVLKGYGDLMNAQYEMKYMRPAGAPPQRLQMATQRPAGSVKFMVSGFPPK